MDNKLYKKIYPTGFTGLDFIENDKDLFPVITDNPLVLIIGKKDCDKRTLAIQIANNIVKGYDKGTIIHDDLDDECECNLIDKKENYLHRFTYEIDINDLYCKFKMISKTKTELYDIVTPTVYILNNKCIKRSNSNDINEKICDCKNINNVLKRIIELCRSVNIILIMTVTLIEESNFPLTKPFKPATIPLNIPSISTILLSNTILRLNNKDNGLYEIEMIKNIDGKPNLKCQLDYKDRKFYDIENKNGGHNKFLGNDGNWHNKFLGNDGQLHDIENGDE